MAAAVVNGAYRVQHVFRRQLARPGDDRLPGGAAADGAALFHNGRAALAVNGSVHAAAAGQGRVGGVDYAIHFLQGDVSSDQFQNALA